MQISRKLLVIEGGIQRTTSVGICLWRIEWSRAE